MEMSQQIWKSVLVKVLLLLSIRYGQGSFIIPEPSISNLSSWASIEVDQVCLENCYSGFSNVSCSQSKVCDSVEICNGRATLPVVEYPLRDWSQTNTNNGCSVSVTNAHPTDPPPAVFVKDDNQPMLIVNRSADVVSPCYAHRNGSVDSIFTVVFWLMARCGNCSVLALSQNGKQSTRIRVAKEQICVNTECQNTPNIDQQWVLISMRVIRNRLTVYVDAAPFKDDNTTLSDNNNSDILIGSDEIAAVGDVFYLFHVRYYRDALTLREIQELRSGMVDPSLLFPDCQCSIDYLEEIDVNNCTDGVSYYPRFNTTQVFKDIDATIDYDLDTNWASSDQGNITITLNFNVSFQIESMVIMFESVLPSQVSYSLYYGEQQKNSGYFLCDSTCRINMIKLDSRSTPTDVASCIADKVQIQLHRHAPEEKRNFIISSIEVTGRCDCGGNADRCILNYENQIYSCSCNQETNTLGQHCWLCTPNFFRLLDQFDCPNSCHCNLDGVANVSNQCEETGGRCRCKGNVEGQMCETCKPHTYKFNGSPSDGCISCSCNQNGTLKCSDSDGSCTCKPNTQPPFCDNCMQNSYGFNKLEGCQPCNCNVTGTIGQNGSCNESTGQCNCKSNAQGLKCESCKPGFYDMDTANQQGCKQCGCHPVGSDTTVCEPNTGQCHCRGGVITNKSCTPVIVSVDPTYGPFIGGTLITISGSLLGNSTHNLAVFLNDIQQDLVSISDTMAIFRTVSYNTSSQLTSQIKLSWKDESSPFSTQAAFTYRANPVVDNTKKQNITTFASGGCQVRIYGTNLQSVKYPQLEVALSSNPMNRTVATCRHNADHVICSVPDLRGFYLSAMDKFQMTAIFDGIKFSDIGNIEVKPDPHLDNVGTIRFQYPFEDTITLSGKNINEACQKYEFTVLTGVINCAIVHISSTEIECAPAVSPPGGLKYYPIEVGVGNIHVTVGTLQYLELQETTGFIIIISCISVAVAVVIAIIIFCHFWRRRKARKLASLLITAEDKNVVSGETSTLNAYSELPAPTVEPTVVTNGHIEAVQRETVFQEPKRGIVNTEAEDSILREEFLPKVDEGLQESIRKCYVGAGHFVTGRYCAIKGKHAQLIDGSLQKSRSPAVKLTIKSLIHPVVEPQLPAWGNQAITECLRLQQCKHPHILSILGIGINKEQFHILYPRMSQYILKTLISDASKEYSVRQLIRFGYQVAEGVTYLVSKGITHKDIAARNCMLDEHSVVKLCDAAFSWDFFEDEYVYDEQRERHLPIRWMAPESLTDGYYDMKTDVWSFAVLVWELLTRGCLPYHEATSTREISNFITQGYILGKPDVISESVYDLLSLCWSLENEHRPSITEVSLSLEEILKTEDDGTYANSAEVSAQMKNQNGNAVTLRLSPGSKNNPYKTSRLSRV